MAFSHCDIAVSLVQLELRSDDGTGRIKPATKPSSSCEAAEYPCRYWTADPPRITPAYNRCSTGNISWCDGSLKKHEQNVSTDETALEPGWLSRELPEFRTKLRQPRAFKSVPAGRFMFTSGDEAEGMPGAKLGN
jgi:hypothetical protein